MNFLINSLKGIRVTALLISSSLALGAEPGSGRTLTELLVEKGIISETEAAQVQSGTPAGLVELLVNKGVISTDEAASLGRADQTRSHPQPASKPAVEKADRSLVVNTVNEGVRNLTFSGRLHAQWDLISTDYERTADPDSVNNLFLRRIYLGATMDFADGLSGNINGNFANDAPGTSNLERGFIQYALSDHHQLRVGYQKVFLGYKEVKSSSEIYAVERSVATRYFTEDLAMGARHTGLFLNGEYDSGIYFNLAATNSEANNISGPSSTDAIALWAQLGWQGDFAGGSLDTGVATGHIPDILADGETDFIWDVYANFEAGNFILFAEVIGGTLEGAGGANPISYSLIPVFRVTDSLELVARYSHLDTDGGIGADISTTFRRAPENGRARFDDVDAYYLGTNWFIRGNALKLSAGYEWAAYEDNLTGSQGDADVEGFRTRLQLLF